MKPITNMTTSLIVTAIILFTLGFAASLVPVTAASEANRPVASDDATTELTELIVEVEGVRNGEGRVIIAVFDSSAAFEAYDYERALDYLEVPAEPGTIKANFGNLGEGPFAVSLFHDENQDYDFNMVGDYPLEGYGTSGARDSYHEPDFEEASVGAGRVTVQMYYLR